jgi:hypothetical protein
MKRKAQQFILLLIVFSITSCSNSKNKKATQPITLKISEVPSSYRILQETTGDLNEDTIVEKVIVYDTERNTDFGTEREIHILKKENDQWLLWKKVIGPVLPSEHGGIMGDPFEEISIENNAIVIGHFGGSRQKWNYRHTYRFLDGDWKLVKAKTYSGAPCDSFLSFDYDLITGQINYSKDVENCEDETSTLDKKEEIRKPKTLPNMDGFSPGNMELTLTNTEITVTY